MLEACEVDERGGAPPPLAGDYDPGLRARTPIQPAPDERWLTE